MKNNQFLSLSDRKIIANIRQQKKVIRTSFCSIYYLPNIIKKLRFAIIIAKKNFKLAVQRNKIRRQIRQIIMDNDNINNYDLLIYIDDKYNDEKYEDNKKAINSVIIKIPNITK